MNWINTHTNAHTHAHTHTHTHTHTSISSKLLWAFTLNFELVCLLGTINLIYKFNQQSINF